MTSLLTVVLGASFAYALYVATLCARRARRSGPGRMPALPAWSFVFAGTGLVVAGVGLDTHLLLTARFGLQASHLAVALVLVGLAGTLLLKRVVLAARISGLGSPGDLLGDYFGSTTLRIAMLVVAGLFAVPVAATALSDAASLVEAVTGGALPRAAAATVLAFALFLPSVLGGWRAIVLVAAGQSLLVLVLLPVVAGFVAADDGVWLGAPIATAAGILADRIPGVFQASAGLGKEVAIGGLWTTTAILSTALAATGLVTSPAMLLMAIGTRTRTGFALNQTWLTAGLAAGLLLVAAPLIASAIAANAAGGVPDAGAIARVAAGLARLEPLAGVALVLMLVTAMQVGVALFAGAGASVVARELVGRSMLPGLTPSGLRLAERITLAAIFAALTLLAVAAPLAAMLAATLALPLAVQLLPAFLGLCWLPWLSRSAVLAGLVVGTLLVVFTEPPGLILFEGLFIDLPWGRWPLTVHAAAWGLAFNLAATLLVAIFTRGGAERTARDRLHDEFRARHPAHLGGRTLAGAKWSLTLLWAFLALGPGAILGNTFFSDPIFAGGPAEVGVPSLWVWQILVWFVGVLLVWWLAYPGRMAVMDEGEVRRVRLDTAPPALFRPRAPVWIANTLARLAGR